MQHITLYSVYNKIKDRLFYFVRAYYCLVNGYAPMLKEPSDLLYFLIQRY